MTRFVSPNAGIWAWLIASIAISVALVIVVAVLWIRDRRPPKLALQWLGAWVLLHVSPIIGIVCVSWVLYASLRVLKARHQTMRPGPTGR
jgi:hypothetical protein